LGRLLREGRAGFQRRADQGLAELSRLAASFS
jgi:hypothetical protein